jgi:hypothetical protein
MDPNSIDSFSCEVGDYFIKNVKDQFGVDNIHAKRSTTFVPLQFYVVSVDGNLTILKAQREALSEMIVMLVLVNL